MGTVATPLQSNGPETVAVIIPTYGNLNEQWEEWADRALESVSNQEPGLYKLSAVRSHAETLAEARNSGAKIAGEPDWLCFLDADDELDRHYVNAMLRGEGDLRQPATLGIVDGVEDDFPVVIPPRPLLEANYIVIGAFVRRIVFEDAGGFNELPALEDWDLWIRCWLDGAVIKPVPDAIYRVHVRKDSRNTRGNGRVHGQAYSMIKRRYK